MKTNTYIASYFKHTAAPRAQNWHFLFICGASLKFNSGERERTKLVIYAAAFGRYHIQDVT